MARSSNRFKPSTIAFAITVAFAAYGCGGTNGYTPGIDSANASSAYSAPPATGASLVGAATTQIARAPTSNETVFSSPSPSNHATQNTIQTAANTLSTTQKSVSESILSTDNITSRELIQASNIVYQGAFALPTGGSSTPYSQEQLGSTRFGFGAGAMSAYKDPRTGKLTLFISGFDGSQVAQVEVPTQFTKTLPFKYSTLPTALLLQKFRDITNGDLSSTSTTLGYNANGAHPRGILPYNGKLLFSAVNWYSYDQKASHGVASIDYTTNQNWSGFFGPSSSVIPIRAIAGAMADVPAGYQAALGGKALTGASSVSVISTASFGPALSSFDPDLVGVGLNFPTNPLLFYPPSKPVCGSFGCDNSANQIFNWTSVIRGFALVTESNTVLFVGTHGIGGYWYGGMTGPNGEQELAGNQWQGPHSTAYEYRLWAYKVSDLALVKSGQKNPWDVKPYAILSLPELTAVDPLGRISSSAYDQTSGLLFVATGFQEEAKIYVYKIQNNN
jgi:hypothetical protein